MNLKIRQRGSVYWLEGRIGEKRPGRARERLRLSLGTRNRHNAALTIGMVERALSQGPDSGCWPELRRILPERSFKKLAAIVGYGERQNPTPPTWSELVERFSAEVKRRIVLGKFRESTWTRYQRTLAVFQDFLRERGITTLESISRPMVEDFKAWRASLVSKQKNARGGRGILLDVAILHRVFAYAVLDCELTTRNPVRLEGRPGDNPEGGAQPFKGEELARLREHAGDDLLALLQ